MEHRSILMLRKVHLKFKKNPKTWNFQILQYLIKKYFLKFFGKIKILKFPADAWSFQFHRIFNRIILIF